MEEHAIHSNQVKQVCGRARDLTSTMLNKQKVTVYFFFVYGDIEMAARKRPLVQTHDF